MTELADNIADVQRQMAAACDRAGRDPQTVTLLAVSKTKSAEMILQAIEAGLQHFGENRVEEAETKIPDVDDRASGPVTWHMVGHIQSRKARVIPSLFSVVHSVDRMKIARRLSDQMAETAATLDVLLEINISGEASKSGFPAAGWESDRTLRETLWQSVDDVLALPGLNVRGLMTMAPIVDDMQDTRPVFRDLARLRAALAESFAVALPDLSMGMTDDYPVAIEEGATIIRVGRAIFGQRN